MSTDTRPTWQELLDEMIEDSIEFGHDDYTGRMRDESERQTAYNKLLELKQQIIEHVQELEERVK